MCVRVRVRESNLTTVSGRYDVRVVRVVTVVTIVRASELEMLYNTYILILSKSDSAVCMSEFKVRVCLAF